MYGLVIAPTLPNLPSAAVLFRRPGRALALVLVLVGMVIPGCSRTSSVRLDQPFAPPSQQELRLASRWAFSDTQNGRQRFLLAFPLPGAEDGPRDFLVYLDAPDGRGDIPVGGADAARGFLIQAVGDLRGRTVFAGGRLRLRGVLFQSRYSRLDVDLECTDGTRVVGTAYVEVAAHEVRNFEQTHSADVAALGGGAATQPIAAPRGEGGPAVPSASSRSAPTAGPE